MGSAAGEIQPGRGLNLVPRDVPAIRCHVERPSRPAGRSLSAAVIEGFVDQEGRRAVVHLAGGTAPTSAVVTLTAGQNCIVQPDGH